MKVNIYFSQSQWSFVEGVIGVSIINYLGRGCYKYTGTTYSISKA